MGNGVRLPSSLHDATFGLSTGLKKENNNLVSRPQTVFSQSQLSTDLGPGTDSRFVAIFATIMDF